MTEMPHLSESAVDGDPAPTVCSIVPPYVLEHLVEHGDPHIAAHARAALARDDHVRRARRGLQPIDGDPQFGRARPTREATAEPSVERSIHDAKTGTDLPGELVRGEGDPATDDVAVTEAYDGLGATWELWFREYGRDSLDGKGMGLVASVHYARDYDNAFWDGTQMVFGDGDGEIFQRFTRSIDVIGHELAHGVTEHTAGLMYQGQSGALNESVSDVFGALVVQRLKNQTATEADWLIGADLLAPAVKGRALRDMRHPGTAYDDPQLGKDPQPDHTDRYVRTSADHGGVHINSGIPNRAFVLAAEALGGHAWLTVGPVWYAVLTGDGISADCDFEAFARLTVTAAATLNGEDSDAVHAVRDAWAAVGVLGPADVPGAPGGTGSGSAGADAESGDAGDAGDAGDGNDGGDAGDAGSEHDGDGADTGTSTPPTDAAVRLSRTGGFAGVSREAYVQLSSLPDQQASQWQSLLGSRTLQRIAARSEEPYPDSFCYGVACEPVDLDVQVPEPDLPDHVRHLFEWTLRRDTPGTD